MRRTPVELVALLALLQGGVAAAEPPAPAGDPLHSAECRSALQVLQVEESAVAPGSRVASSGASASTAKAAAGTLDHASPHVLNPKLAGARRSAAAACLASRADPAPLPQHLAQPPIAVAPVATPPAPIGATAAPRPALPPPNAALPSPALPPPAPTSVLSCDLGGCWANDGSRLNRVGPNLWGPRGACTVQGTLLQCP